jgi:hypothetical protein
MGDDGDPDVGHMSDSSRSSGEPLQEEDPANKLRRHQLDAKIEFDENKKNILDSIPKAYKEKFGQIGFSRWGKKWHPCQTRTNAGFPGPDLQHHNAGRAARQRRHARHIQPAMRR